jgi:hypothetical protein
MLDVDSLPSPDSSTTSQPNNSFLPSSKMKTKKQESINESDESAEDLFHELVASVDFKVGKASRGNIFFDGVDKATRKKKKKGKDKKEKPKDFNKEFERESIILQNLLVEQSKFVQSLQRQYEHITGTKSSSRGVTKNVTDLIENITSARKLNMDIIKHQVDLKKTIADLTMKQQKELNAAGFDGENMADFASTYLKQMISERQNLLTGGSSDIGDYSVDEMADIVENTLKENVENMDERTSESDIYLKYENRNVEISVLMNRNNTDEYEFVAYDENGVLIPDYPKPSHTDMKINWSTEVATDEFGQKYNIIWDD